MNLSTIIKISRPRFWLYLGGTYLVGFVFGITTIAEALTPLFFLHLLYFALFANIFLYGVNDWYDRDTDKYNEKKGSKEHKLQKRDDFVLKRWLFFSTLLGLVLVALFFSTTTLLLWLFWFFLSYYYSAPPLRFKARPIIDSLSNILYVIPGFLGYVHATGMMPPLGIIIGAGAWTAGMHLFSAIPDIKADKKANLLTTAVLFGHNASLLLVTLYWLITAFFVISLNSLWTLLFFIYPLLSVLVLLLKNKIAIEKIYWLFPYINAGMGFILFLGGALG